VTTKPLKKGATYDDLVRVPENYVAEMFDGELYASPRPAPRHGHAAVALVAKIGGPFQFDRDPGGWLLLIEPELHFRNDVLVPDLAAWRRERLPAVPDEPYLTLTPDWVCEVLSPSTETIDWGRKLGIYAREGVPHVWLVDPLRQSLEVLTLVSGRLEQIAEHHGDVSVRARPFDAIALELRALWS
jgi:Uma2 family endonuclease